MIEDNKKDLTKLMEGFEQVCKLKGLRITHQRSQIFYELARYPGHPTAEIVFSKVRKHLKTISLDTVYRTIATFEENGLIMKIQLVDNTTRYDINLTVHHHLICSRCKKVVDFYWPDFDQMKLPDNIQAWGQVERTNVVINGICSECQKLSN